MVVETAQEGQLARPRLLQRTLIRPEAHVREMGSEGEADQPAHARARRLGGAVRDERLGVLHAHERGQPEPVADRGRLPPRDRRERRAANRAVAGLQLLESLRRWLASAADVRVVSLDARLTWGAAIRHAQAADPPTRHSPPPPPTHS